MCGGQYSTLIAKNRDKKPHINRYNSDEFLEHLKPFIKHVKTFEFLGGEPFLVPQHYKIWDLIKIENPQARVSMVSNGSIYNSKVESILKELPNSIVNVSLDAVTPEIYSYIRRNGNIDTVKENIKKFKILSRLGSISVCPMIQNIRDIPNVINFCQEIGVDIWFNDVQQALGHMWKDLYETGCMERETPSDTAIDVEKIKEFRLWTLPKQELQDHIDYLKGYNVPDRYKDRMNSFINYLGNYVSNIKSS
jgi:MoaA/NifB/PqqE/SkfB family radical SAM enzyme